MSPCWWLFCWILFFPTASEHHRRYFKSGRDTSVWNSQGNSQQLQTRFLFLSAQLQHKIFVIILVFSFAYCHWSHGLANETWNLKWVTALPIFGTKRKWNPWSKTSQLLICSATLWPVAGVHRKKHLSQCKEFSGKDIQVLIRSNSTKLEMLSPQNGQDWLPPSKTWHDYVMHTGLAQLNIDES